MNAGHGLDDRVCAALPLVSHFVITPSSTRGLILLPLHRSITCQSITRSSSTSFPPRQIGLVGHRTTNNTGIIPVTQKSFPILLALLILLTRIQSTTILGRHTRTTSIQGSRTRSDNTYLHAARRSGTTTRTESAVSLKTQSLA